MMGFQTYRNTNTGLSESNYGYRLALKEERIRNNEKDNEVYVYIEENGKAKKVLVTTGIDTGENIQITSGLEEGMNVVTKGQTYLTDGEDVQVITDTVLPEEQNQEQEEQTAEQNLSDSEKEE